MSNRPTFKVKVSVTSSVGVSYIDPEWRANLTDAQVFTVRDEIRKRNTSPTIVSTGFLRTPTHPYGTVFRFAGQFEQNGIRYTTTAWVVNENV